MNKSYEFFEDINAQLFQNITGIKTPHSQSYWVRYQSHESNDFFHLIKNELISKNTYACLIDDDSNPNHFNERNKIFLGAFGKNGLLSLNKKKSYREILKKGEATLLVDFCRITPETFEEFLVFTKTLFKPKIGFILLANDEINQDIFRQLAQLLITEKSIDSFLEKALKINIVLGLPMEDNNLTRSIFFIGRDSKNTIYKMLSQLNEKLLDSNQIFEMSRIFGDRLINDNKFKELVFYAPSSE